MPDSRKRRGAHPQDARCFAPEEVPRLRRAVDDLAWLLDRGYPDGASARLVGDRYALRTRQRTAVIRCCASTEACRERRRREVAAEEMTGRTLVVDGYNVLLTVEAALGGGVILRARDGTLRDMAAMSGHYRKVLQTPRALAHVGEVLEALGCVGVRWLLDRPVSNSGRLRTLLLELAEARGWRWEVDLVPNPDPLLAASDQIVATADSGILDQKPRWLNLAALVVERSAPEAWIVDLRGSGFS